MRAKRTIVFILSAILAGASLYEIWSAVSLLITSKPQRIWVSDVNILTQEERWIGAGRSRTSETFTVADLHGQRLLVIGNPRSDGWILPSVHPDRYRHAAEDLADGRDLVVFHRFHPYIRYSVGFLAATAFFAITAFVCYRCFIADAWT